MMILCVILRIIKEYCNLFKMGLTYIKNEGFFKEGFFLQWDAQWDFVAWGLSHRQAYPLESQISCYVPDFYLEDKEPWCIFKHGFFFKRDFQKKLQSQEKKRVWKSPSLKEFSKVFYHIQDKIRSHQLKKAVPVVFAQSDGEISCGEKKQALSRHPFGEWPQIYGWWVEGEGILGCTPELLLTYHPEDKTICTMALAGTKSRGELLQDPKEQMEHQLVVEGIRQCLQKIGCVQTGPTYEWSYQFLRHLRTDIKVRVKEKLDFQALCKSMHPTPALGLSSDTFHWKWLKEIDPSIPRGRFGAPFGVQLPDGRAKAVVAIRNIQWLGGKSYLGAGCGIVKLSQLHQEWRELALKRKFVICNLF